MLFRSSLNICVTNNSNGTNLFRDGEYHSTISKTNTGLLFCSEKNVTLHNIDASESTIIYLNVFFYKIDPWYDDVYLKENIATLDQDVLKWQNTMFSQGKLFRSCKALPNLTV